MFAGSACAKRYKARPRGTRQGRFLVINEVIYYPNLLIYWYKEASVRGERVREEVQGRWGQWSVVN